MAWASVSPLRHVAAEDELVDALGAVVVDAVVVEEETGEDVTGHMSVERLLFVDRDMLRRRRGEGQKTKKALPLKKRQPLRENHSQKFRTVTPCEA